MVLPYQPHTSLPLSARTPRCYRQVPTSVAEGMPKKQPNPRVRAQPRSLDGPDGKQRDQLPPRASAQLPLPTGEPIPAWGWVFWSCWASLGIVPQFQGFHTAPALTPAPLEPTEGVCKPCWKHSRKTQILCPTQRDMNPESFGNSLLPASPALPAVWEPLRDGQHGLFGAQR